MRHSVCGLLLCISLCGGWQARAVTLDRIALIVNSHPIKDTDIERDIRLTAFLNGDAFSLVLPERKKATQRLIDQAIIRREVQLGNYSSATPEEVGAFLQTVKAQRYPTDSGYQAALARYGVSDAELQDHLKWQLTVLHFIDQRFRPAIIVSAEEVDSYGRTHKGTREELQEQLTARKVNEEFESWLNRAGKRAQIEYREVELQ